MTAQTLYNRAVLAHAPPLATPKPVCTSVLQAPLISNTASEATANLMPKAHKFSRPKGMSLSRHCLVKDKLNANVHDYHGASASLNKKIVARSSGIVMEACDQKSPSRCAARKTIGDTVIICPNGQKNTVWHTLQKHNKPPALRSISGMQPNSYRTLSGFLAVLNQRHSDSLNPGWPHCRQQPALGSGCPPHKIIQYAYDCAKSKLLRLGGR